MPRKKWIDKSTAATYQLLHRPQNDPRIHDESSSSMVFQELAPAQARKARNRADLESELFGSDNDDTGRPVRNNEGEAAEYGIYYDDTDYDYMQHMRDLGGDGGSESIWVEAPKTDSDKGKVKDRVSLDEALKEMDLSKGQEGFLGGVNANRLTDKTILPSTTLRKITYQDQQDVPDSLSGFQPDMDPRLREALEALEDEAYVDNDGKDDSFFTSIASNGRELSFDEFGALEFVTDEDDEGWETDDTAKPVNEYKNSPGPNISFERQTMSHAIGGINTIIDDALQDAPDHGDGAFMASFRDISSSSQAGLGRGQASVVTGQSAFTAGGSRRKKRKGALTNSDAYSMTSSSLYRTEGLTLLDARFDKTLEEYAEDGEYDEDSPYADDDVSSVASSRASNISGMSGISRSSAVSRTSTQPPNLVVRKDFEDIMDEFLGGYSMKGKRRMKKGGLQSGMEQLDEIRKELGGPVGKAATIARGE